MVAEIVGMCAGYLIGMAMTASAIQHGNNEEEMTRLEWWAVILWPVVMAVLVLILIWGFAQITYAAISNLPWLFGFTASTEKVHE